MKASDKGYKIAIIGLGYVGLPLFCLFSKHYACIGLDKDKIRINYLNKAIDYRECEKRHNIRQALQRSILTSSYSDLRGCNIFIVCVPTGTDIQSQPDLTPLKNVCKSLSNILKKDDIVIFESTVFPGATEEICVPILEEGSSMKINKGFTVGYSPERINVGDNIHTLENVRKIVSGSTPHARDVIANVYQSVLKENVVVASSIKIAEAAKMYENVQRDVVIALANEFADYCRAESIDINEVTDCAATKWNFNDVRPGMVGGHCIGVDPYYLLNRATIKGVDLPLVSQSRKTNEKKVTSVANRILDLVSEKESAKILLLGFSYKKNCADIRNTKVAEIIKILEARGIDVECYDPLVNIEQVKREYSISLLPTKPDLRLYDSIIIMVNHSEFWEMQNSNKFDEKVIHSRNFL